MIRIYSESLTLKNASNPEAKDTISFSLKSMVEYFVSMENIMYMEKDTEKGKHEKHRMAMQSFDKDFVIASLKRHCIKKSTDNSMTISFLFKLRLFK